VDRFTVTAADRFEIAAVRWLPSGPVRALLMISRGMAEHVSRYQPLAAACTTAGNAVHGHDHRGHGQSVDERTPRGHFADQNGWPAVVGGLQALHDQAGQHHPQVPVFLFAHSMGAAIARDWLLTGTHILAGAIISAPSWGMGPAAAGLARIAHHYAKRHGPRTSSQRMTRLIFGAFNLPFLPSPTRGRPIKGVTGGAVVTHGHSHMKLGARSTHKIKYPEPYPRFQPHEGMIYMVRRSEGSVEVPSGRSMRYAVAVPENDRPPGGWPGVIVVFEVYGMTPEMLAVGDRFADRGWAACIPDLFSTGWRWGCLVRALREVTAGHPGPVTACLAAASRDFAARNDVDAERLAVIGFCMGGGLALLLGSVQDLGLRAVASNYGPTPSTQSLRTSPPVVASYGGRDGIMRGQPERLQARLEACKVAFDIKTYPQAGHAFLTNGHHPASGLVVPMHAGFDADAAHDAWNRIDTWLDQHTPIDPTTSAE
jgi:carboxymethylenebutenolidase